MLLLLDSQVRPGPNSVSIVFMFNNIVINMMK